MQCRSNSRRNLLQPGSLSVRDESWEGAVLRSKNHSTGDFDNWEASGLLFNALSIADAGRRYRSYKQQVSRPSGAARRAIRQLPNDLLEGRIRPNYERGSHFAPREKVA